jgi:hypothetical protein
VKSGTDAGKTCAKNGPFSLRFSQIVALMLPHRSRFVGLLLLGACPILALVSSNHEITWSDSAAGSTPFNSKAATISSKQA